MASFLGNLFSGEAAKEAAEKNRLLFSQYGQAGRPLLDAGLAGSKEALAGAGEAFGPLSELGQKYAPGTDLLLDAYGAGGPEGSARARMAYGASPGLDVATDFALDANDRRAGARGMLNSGNTVDQGNAIAAKFQLDDFQKWRSGLSGFVNPELLATGGAATGVAGTFGKLSDVYQGDASNRINLEGNVASGTANANTFQAQGEMQGSQNLLGLGLGLGSLAMGMPPGTLSSLGKTVGTGMASATGFNPMTNFTKGGPYRNYLGS